MSLRLCPITLKEANDYVKQHHRHHGASVGHKFSIAVKKDGELCGVAICGRPVSRHLDDGYTIEVTRLCTDGTKNACSALYSACARAGKAMGYRSIITYTLESENGSSLKASGFICEGVCGGLEWTGIRKPKSDDQYPHELKKRWRKML